MSKKKSSSDKGDQAPDLSALDFGPAWARHDNNKKPRKSPQRKPSRGPRSDGDGARDGGHGGGKNQERGRGRRDRGDFKKGGRQRTPIAPPAEGVTARIMPIEEGMDAMAKQILATGRTHSVFELAWVVLGGMDRFHVIFESEEQIIYRSNSDHSVWLTQKECMAHLWSSGLINRYYDEEITEIDAPSGNFQSVARCGYSGRLIGPPNHHAYQQTLLDLHREKFSNIALDRYKGKIIMEHSEEAVQEWIDSMRQHKRWRPKVEKPHEAEKPLEAEKGQEAEKNQEAEADASTDVQAEASPDQDLAAEASVETPAVETAPEPTPTPVIEETVVILDSHREVEQHFLSHGFEKEFDSGKMMSTLASIPARMISPGLMTVLKNAVAEEKRYPGNLASILCRQMSGRHLAVYKWKKRLHCGPARPKHIPDDMVIADRPSALFHWVMDHPSGSIDTMWKDCLPADIDDAGRQTWYHDLHWLINEGLVLLFSDGTLHAAKELEKKPAQQKAKLTKQVKKKKAPKVSTEKPVEVEEEKSAVESNEASSPSAKEDSSAAEPLPAEEDQTPKAN